MLVFLPSRYYSPKQPATASEMPQKKSRGKNLAPACPGGDRPKNGSGGQTGPGRWVGRGLGQDWCWLGQGCAHQQPAPAVQSQRTEAATTPPHPPQALTPQKTTPQDVQRGSLTFPILVAINPISSLKVHFRPAFAYNIKIWTIKPLNKLIHYCPMVEIDKQESHGWTCHIVVAFVRLLCTVVVLLPRFVGLFWPSIRP